MPGPTFVYTALVPLANQQKNVSQPIMEENFQAIPELISQDHETFNSPNFGHHKSSTYTDQTGQTPIFNGWCGLWAENYSVTSTNEIWFNTYNANPANSLQYPITASILSTNPTKNTPDNNWSYLPSGMILKTGIGTGNGLVTVTLPNSASVPKLTQILNVMVCPYNTTAADNNIAVSLVNVIAPLTAPQPGAPTPGGFTVYVSNRTTTGPSVGPANSFQYYVFGW